jgi:hypothetical protein
MTRSSKHALSGNTPVPGTSCPCYSALRSVAAAYGDGCLQYNNNRLLRSYCALVIHLCHRPHPSAPPPSCSRLSMLNSPKKTFRTVAPSTWPTGANRPPKCPDMRSSLCRISSRWWKARGRGGSGASQSSVQAPRSASCCGRLRPFTVLPSRCSVRRRACRGSVGSSRVSSHRRFGRQASCSSYCTVSACAIRCTRWRQGEAGVVKAATWR